MSSLEPGFIFNNPAPEEGGSPIDTSPFALMRTLSTSPVLLFLGFIVKSASPTAVLTAFIATQAPVCPV